MPPKLSTTVSKIKLLSNKENARIIYKFYEFMKENDASERHQNNNLKATISYSIFLGNRHLKEVNKKEDILSCILTKIKDKEQDPEQKWITTYNDYLHRIKHFYRWLYNAHEKENISIELWNTPKFMEDIKSKKTKRLSPYSETEIWEKDEFLSIVKYESYKSFM